MGNYTEFELTVDLKYDESLFRILSFMADSDIPTIDIQTPMFGNPNAIDHRTEKKQNFHPGFGLVCSAFFNGQMVIDVPLSM